MKDKGKFNLTLEDIRGISDVSRLIKNDTWIIEHVYIFPMIRKLKIAFDELFDGNREMIAGEMILHTLNVFSVVTFGLCAAERLHLPMSTCKRDSNVYNCCLKHAVTEAWPLFVKGLPEFEFPPLDPLFYKYQEVVIDNGNLHGNISMANAIIVGLAATRFTAMRSHFGNEAFRLEVDARIPKLILNGVCEVHGRTLAGFSMTGKVELIMTFVNEYWLQLYQMILPVIAECWDKSFSDIITPLFAKVSFSQLFP